MAMVFPTSPIVGQVFTSGSRSWVWNGSAWDSPSAINVLQVPYGLELIRTQTIGTAVSSVVVTNIFSANYDTYKIVINGGVGSTNLNIGLQIGASTTGYYAGQASALYSTGNYFGTNTNNGANFGLAGYATTGTISLDVEIRNPFLTSVTYFSSQRIIPITSGEAGLYSGFLNNTTSHTGFTILTGAPTLTGGEIRIYGYRKA
jgi:hypothetical protein